jgi:NAD(P)-dependent dehydrogenase (short-subunit alcohol dehydrogenase family)
MKLANKVAFITGAAAGIGRATRFLFARENERVAVVNIYPERIGSLVKEIDCTGREAEVVGCLGTAEEIARAALSLVSDDASFVTGAVFSIVGGFTR